MTAGRGKLIPVRFSDVSINADSAVCLLNPAVDTVPAAKSIPSVYRSCQMVLRRIVHICLRQNPQGSDARYYNEQ
jgi:hypothetical protein